MDPREYIVSEKFIWDDLLAKGEETVRHVRKTWKKKRRVTRMLLAFPAEHVKADDGSVIKDIVGFEPPATVSSFEAAKLLAKRTKAYALLLVERVGNEVKIVLESHHGTRAWTIPVAQHGDVEVLEKEKATTDTESIGVLWRPSSGRG